MSEDKELIETQNTIETETNDTFSDDSAKSTNEISIKKQKIARRNNIALNLTKFYLFLILLSFIRAFFTYVFLAENEFAPGGLSGFALLISQVIIKTTKHIPTNPHLLNLYKLFTNDGFLIFLLNLPLLIPAFILLNKKFALNTFICVSLFGAMMALFKYLNTLPRPLFPKFDVSGNSNAIKLLEAIVGGAGAGVSLGLMLRSNTSMGGTDIVGKIIYKYNSTADPQWWIFACDCIIVLLSGIFGILQIEANKATMNLNDKLIAVLSPIIYSFISLIATSKMADIIQSGFQTSIVFHIISSKQNEIADELVEKVKRGVTIIHGTGHYTKTEKNILLCVVRKRQINIVKSTILKLDPSAFMYLTKANEVNGGIGYTPLRSNS